MLKHTLSIAMVLAFTLAAGQTTTVNSSEPVGVQLTTTSDVGVPSVVSARYEAGYPNRRANWTKEEDNFMATYTDPDNQLGREVVYDRFGNVLRTGRELDKESYPLAVKNYYSKHYPRQKYSVWQSEDDKGAKTYYTWQGGSRFWFDKNGKPVQSAPKR